MKLLTFIVIILSLCQCIIFAIVYNYYNTTSQFRCTCKKYQVPFPLSKTSATMINLCLTFSLLTIIRLPKRWVYIPFRMKYLHIYFAVWMCIWSIVHSVSHYHTFIKFKYPLFLSGVGSTGHILLLLLLTVFISSLPYFRKRVYQYFLYFHYVFLVLFTIILLIHGNLCFLKNDAKECLISTSWMWLLFPLVYLLTYTIYKFTKRTKVISFVNCGNDIIELQLDLSESYAGKTIWICCPLISYLEWHPFTVCMYKNNRCYLYYKIRGDWTCKFYETLIKEKQLSLLVEGPYCSLPKNILNTITKKQVVLVSSGIGITPYINLFQEILDNDIFVNNLHIIVIIRHEKEIQWLLPLIKQIYKKKNVNMKLYFTSHVAHYVLEYIEIPYIFGRPDFSDILRYNTVKNEVTNIYYSGKTSVGRDVQKICDKEKNYNFYYVN
jgi:hypothetical protein